MSWYSICIVIKKKKKMSSLSFSSSNWSHGVKDRKSESVAYKLRWARNNKIVTFTVHFHRDGKRSTHAVAKVIRPVSQSDLNIQIAVLLWRGAAVWISFRLFSLVLVNCNEMRDERDRKGAVSLNTLIWRYRCAICVQILRVTCSWHRKRRGAKSNFTVRHGSGKKCGREDYFVTIDTFVTREMCAQWSYRYSSSIIGVLWYGCGRCSCYNIYRYFRIDNSLYMPFFLVAVSLAVFHRNEFRT